MAEWPTLAPPKCPFPRHAQHALIRDARIELRQGNARTAETDLGVVPLVYFAGEYNPMDRLTFVLDVEGLGASQGRAIDGALKMRYHFTRNLSLGLGYRVLEGGADVDRVYNFAWIHYAVASVGLRF